LFNGRTNKVVELTVDSHTEINITLMHLFDLNIISAFMQGCFEINHVEFKITWFNCGKSARKSHIDLPFT
jgi:hypothetical protein